jgi:hypothetical protein
MDPAMLVVPSGSKPWNPVIGNAFLLRRHHQAMGIGTLKILGWHLALSVPIGMEWVAECRAANPEGSQRAATTNVVLATGTDRGRRREGRILSVKRAKTCGGRTAISIADHPGKTAMWSELKAWRNNYIRCNPPKLCVLSCTFAAMASVDLWKTSVDFRSFNLRSMLLAVG